MGVIHGEHWLGEAIRLDLEVKRTCAFEVEVQEALGLLKIMAILSCP